MERVYIDVNDWRFEIFTLNPLEYIASTSEALELGLTPVGEPTVIEDDIGYNNYAMLLFTSELVPDDAIAYVIGNFSRIRRHPEDISQIDNWEDDRIHVPVQFYKKGK